jgi:large subunit ribosomal protein L4
MPQIDVYNQEANVVKSIELSDAVFGIEPNQQAIYDAVLVYQAGLRQGTHSTKTRAFVSGTGKKPFRQKGTGRHRQGSTTDPSQVGGGVAFAPKPRSYRYTVPKKVRRLAMFSALSSKVKENEIIVVDALDFAEPKTKEMIKFLEAVKAGKKSLIVTDAKNENVVKSASNIPGVVTTTATQMNVYEIINHNSFIITKDAVKKIEEVYA